jgi:hypothetical protein
VTLGKDCGKRSCEQGPQDLNLYPSETRSKLICGVNCLSTCPSCRRCGAGLSELSDQLSLVYIPVYDPDANRIEWRCAHLTPHRHASSSSQRRANRCQLQPEHTLRRSRVPLMTCLVISAVFSTRQATRSPTSNCRMINLETFGEKS